MKMNISGIDYVLYLMLKVTNYATFTRCNESLRCPKNVSVKFQLKFLTEHLLYHLENAYFEWKHKHNVFVHVSLNVNEILLPAPFSRIGLCFYSSLNLRYSAKKHLFGFDYHVYHAEIIRFKVILV